MDTEPPGDGVLTNLEGHTDYDVRRPDGELEPGFTAVLRVRDEAASLPFVLPPLLRAVKRVVVVDNRSTDGTADVARRVAAEEGAADRLEVGPVPVRGRALRTPSTSARRPTRCTASPTSTTGRSRTCGPTTRSSGTATWCSPTLQSPRCAASRGSSRRRGGDPIPRHPLYVADDRLAFLDVELRNCEPWGWPNRPEHRFVKAMEWEMPLWRPDIGGVTPPSARASSSSISTPTSSTTGPTPASTSRRTRRKRREYEVFTAIAGGGEPLPGVVRIDAPPGEHVIDHVRTSWTQAAAVGSLLNIYAIGSRTYNGRRGHTGPRPLIRRAKRPSR